MQALIAFWKAKLDDNFLFMAREDKAIIKQTIVALQELKKLRATNQIQREADIVRTVKDLESFGKREEAAKKC
jgi:uncharacterized protein Yka (UPF0111/DUF47 family)